MRIKAYIAGCRGLRLTVEEARFFRSNPPWGFILFARNIDTPEQVRALTAEMRECTGRADTPILVDQEGGRVQRLKPPHWPKYPSAGEIGRILCENPQSAERAAWLQGRLIASDLAAIGINTNCLPVLDVLHESSHDVVGDRAYSSHPQIVTLLGRMAGQGSLAGGVLPIIKHIPGHGRAQSDSHLELPRVDTHLAILGCTDFYPFMQLADMPVAMTAHIVYSSIDAQNPATQSVAVIQRIIRGWFGFDGLLLSDDLSMNALSGDFSQRAMATYSAGCDIVLHCNGEMTEMQAVADVAPDLVGVSAQRAEAALAMIGPIDTPAGEIAAYRAEFDELTAIGSRQDA